MAGIYFTVILQVAFLPLAVLTVMVAVPFFRAFTTPLLVIVAIFLLLLVQVSLAVALEGLTVALSVSVVPTTSVALVLFSFTCLGLISLPFSSVCVTGMLLDWAKVSAVLPEGVLISSFGQFIRLLSPIFSRN